MNIETAGTETDRVIDALPASYFREAITGRLSVQNGLVQNGLPEEDEFQAILQQMIEPLGPINPEGASNPSLHSDLPSTIYTNTTDVGEDIQAIEWATTTDAEVPAVHPLPELKLNSQHLPSDQLTRRPNPVEMGPVKPDHSGKRLPARLCYLTFSKPWRLAHCGSLHSFLWHPHKSERCRIRRP